MGTLGKYLRDAREALGIDLRDAAQQTRISIQYLKALEEEDFSRLPGEVFVKGFLKNYVKFLHVDESEVLKRYKEIKPQKASSGIDIASDNNQAGVKEQKTTQGFSIEPFAWAAGILIALLLFVFTALPTRTSRQTNHTAIPSPEGQTVRAPIPALNKPDKLYLEVTALEDTWVLVRTDTSPQKKAVLKKGESLVWSADERFQLTYSGTGALKLALNGQELSVGEAKKGVVRELIITASGIENRKIQTENERPVRPKRQPAELPQPVQPRERQPLPQRQQPQTPEQQTLTPSQQTQPSGRQKGREQQRRQESVPQGPPAPSPAQPISPESQQTSTQ